MPLINRTAFPSYDRLKKEGVILADKNDSQLRNLNVGILNIMPDAALQATERQFLRLISSYPKATINCSFFTLQDIKREKTTSHIEQHYQPIEQLKNQHLDALIITGTNVPVGEMSQANFWQSLINVFSWCEQYQLPTLYACLATHAAIEYFYKQKRQRLTEKCWGVFEHTVEKEHPLVKNLPHKIDVPHSRFNEINKEQLNKAHLKILIHSKATGFHLAVSQKHPYFTFFQGHQEYDDISILKEYKRDIYNYTQHCISYPDLPKHYFSDIIIKQLSEFKHLLQANKVTFSAFPEQDIVNEIKNTWHSAGKTVINNWLEFVESYNTKI